MSGFLGLRLWGLIQELINVMVFLVEIALETHKFDALKNKFVDVQMIFIEVLRLEVNRKTCFLIQIALERRKFGAQKK